MSEPQEKLDISDLKENFLECPVCVEHFNQTDRRPRLLHSCLHAFCTQCLHQLLQKEGKDQITCPLCRQVQKVKGKADTLPVDPVRDKLVEYVQVKQGQNVHCTDCPDNNVASFRCSDCGWFLCKDCQSAHLRHPTTRNHSVSTLEELQAQPMENMKRKHICKVHTSHEIEFYCMTCDQLCCLSCTVLTHKGHDFEQVDIAARKKMRDFESSLKIVEEKTASTKRALAGSKKVEKDIQKNLELLTVQINEAFDAKVLLLNQRRQDLLDEVKVHSENLSASEHGNVAFYSDRLAVLETTRTYYFRMKANADAVDVLSIYSSLKDNFQSLTQDSCYFPETAQGEPDFMKFIDSDDISKSVIKSFGSLKSPKGATMKILTALYDFEAVKDEDLSFKKGDRMELLKEIEKNWWLVKHQNGKRGHIPSNCVALLDNTRTSESQDWFCGNITRIDADHQLLVSGFQPWTFLVRESEESPGASILSIRDNDGIIKHHKITHKSSCYTDSSKVFNNLLDLIDHYREAAYGLRQKLKMGAEEDASLETPRDSLTLDKLLYTGEFSDSEVWQGKWKGSTDVAIETFRSSDKTSVHVLAQISILQKCKHDKIVSLHAVCTKEKPIYIVTELMIRGDLRTYLREGRGKTLAVHHLMDISAQIANGMAYLERRKVIHRDLAARNILIAKNNAVKIGGFHLALQADEYTLTESHKFPIRWVAPEVFLQHQVSIKSDVWSFGVLLTELMTRGQVPYPGLSQQDVLDKVTNGYRMPRPRECLKEVYDIMLKCWDKDAKKRPTFDYLSSFFDDLILEKYPQNRKYRN